METPELLPKKLLYTGDNNLIMEDAGLTTQQAEKLLQTQGLNEIEEKHDSFTIKVTKKFISPISLMLLAASLLSLATNKVFDFFFILFLLFLNILISLWQENKADNAIKKLNEHLSSKVKALRDGQWTILDSKKIVPGDIIQLATGDIIPADGQILEVKNIAINEAALTGESLPKEKNKGDTAYSGSFLTTGLLTMQITATGKNTYFGKTLSLIEKDRGKSLLEKDVLSISKFLSILSITGVVLMSLIFLIEKTSLTELLTLDLSLIIAGIPISLPTVMTLIIEFGVLNLAPKNVIVRRLSALEDLANANLLLTDKTGTMTENKITVQEVLSYGSFNQEDILKWAFLSSQTDDRNSINKAIIEKAYSLKINAGKLKVVDFTTADSVRKRSSAVVEQDGKKIIISLGAPQVIASLSVLSPNVKKKFGKDVSRLADRGYRALALAINRKNQEEKNMELVGLIALSDTLQPDAKDVISFMKANNIEVVMLTGDNQAISQEIVNKLGIDGGKIISRDQLNKLGWDNIDKDFFHHNGGIAQILPDDKYRLVIAAKKYFVVAVSGDGVNDLPAIKEANVGFAVKNAVDALKAAADIVLLSEGIAVIRDAIMESRKIFSRVYSYSVYRISESFRLIITIVVLGIWYKLYPLTPLQIILIALLNDIPIISLAFDRVKQTTSPAKINVKERFILSTLFGTTGIANSLILFVIMTKFLHLDWGIIQTIYFLKLTVSGHMLIYIAHTKERWFKFLPSKEVILATSLTQIVSTVLALTGFLMPTKISIGWIIFIWIWAFFWMQISELMKDLQKLFSKKTYPVEEIAQTVNPECS